MSSYKFKSYDFENQNKIFFYISLAFLNKTMMLESISHSDLDKFSIANLEDSLWSEEI